MSASVYLWCNVIKKNKIFQSKSEFDTKKNPVLTDLPPWSFAGCFQYNTPMHYSKKILATKGRAYPPPKPKHTRIRPSWHNNIRGYDKRILEGHQFTFLLVHLWTILASLRMSVQSTQGIVDCCNSFLHQCKSIRISFMHAHTHSNIPTH